MRPRCHPRRLFVELLEERTLLYGGNGLQFNITATAAVSAQMLAAFQTAANLWSSVLADDILINVNLDYVGTLPVGTIGVTTPAAQIVDLPTLRAGIVGDQKSATDILAAAHLPAGNSTTLYTTDFNTGAPYLDNNATDNNNNFTITRANAKSLGLRTANNTAIDGSIQFSNKITFDFDRSDGIAAGRTDFIGVAVHELGHLLGFLSGAATVDYRSKPNGAGWTGTINEDNYIVLRSLDLFRYSSASFAAGGAIDIRGDSAAKYFSLDGGVTSLASFSTGTYNGDAREADHWKDNLSLGIMDPSIASAEYADVTMLDVQALDAIGWDIKMDFGDAPDTGAGTSTGNQQTSLADNGPRHILFSPTGLITDPNGTPKVFLGTGVTGDLDGKPNATATGDTDDGVASFPALVPGNTVNVTVTSSATAVNNAVLNYFVDFNQDGDFADVGESFTATLTGPSQLVPVTIPAGATLGSTFARFRISTAGGLGPTGTAADGEVEDYAVSISAPDLTVTASNNVGGSTTLGSSWTWTIHIANSGTSPATFAAGQTLLYDNLPSVNITFGAVNVANLSGVTGTILPNLLGNFLTATASGAVTIDAGGSFDVTFTATPSATGTFTNPGGVFLVDPAGVIAESNETNNTASDAVNIITIGVVVSPTTLNVAEGGADDSYTVVLSSQPTANVIVFLGADAQISTPLPSLVFTSANWNVAQVVTVSAVEDSAVEGPHTGTILHTTMSADPLYNNLAVAAVVANITDNDTAAVAVTLAGGSISVVEGASVTYTVVLNAAPTQPVVIDLTGNTQVNVSPASLTFTSLNWSTPQPVVVTAIDDTDVEGPHQGIVTQTLNTTDPLFIGASVGNVTADIIDNEGPVIQGTSGVDQIVVSSSADGSQILVSINGKVSSFASTIAQLRILAGAGNDYVQILNPSVPMLVQGDAGTDKVFVIGRTGLPNNFVVGAGIVTANAVDVNLVTIEGLIVGGGTAGDTFDVTAVPAYPVSLKGDLGPDTVLGPAATNTWAITGSNSGTLNKTITLNSIENLSGGSGTDTFVFSSGKSITGALDGGAGNNTLDYTAYLSAVTVNLQTGTATGMASMGNISNLVGGRGSDKLIGLDQSNLWNVTSKNTGDVGSFTFRSVENLTGGLLGDTFHLTDAQGVSGRIDGGGGIDTLDYSSYLSAAVSINLQTKRATNLGSYLNLESFQGGSGTNDTIVGWNALNAWSLNAVGAGYVTATNLAAAFGNFENLTGGTLVDTFTLAVAGDWVGLLNGGTGNDYLFAFGTGNVYAGTSTGTLNGRRFQSIEGRR